MKNTQVVSKTCFHRHFFTLSGFLLLCLKRDMSEIAVACGVCEEWFTNLLMWWRRLSRLNMQPPFVVVGEIPLREITSRLSSIVSNIRMGSVNARGHNSNDGAFLNRLGKRLYHEITMALFEFTNFHHYLTALQRHTQGIIQSPDDDPNGEAAAFTQQLHHAVGELTQILDAFTEIQRKLAILLQRRIDGWTEATPL